MKTQQPDIHQASRSFWETQSDSHCRHNTEEWRRIAAGELTELLGRGGTLLDIGCGCGDFLPYMQSHYETVFGVDFSPRMLATARERLSVCKITNCQLFEGSAEQLPPEIPIVDHILANGVLQYLNESSIDIHLKQCLSKLTSRGNIVWGLVPNASRQDLWYAGALGDTPLPFAKLVRSAWGVIRKKRMGLKTGDALWDGVGNWFTFAQLSKIAERNGCEIAFRHSWFFEYRFHAILKRQSDAPA